MFCPHDTRKCRGCCESCGLCKQTTNLGDSQEHGSLRDMLQNQTFLIEEDLAFSMIKDVVQVENTEE